MATLFDENISKVDKFQQLIDAHKELKIKYQTLENEKKELEKKLSDLQKEYQILQMAKVIGLSESDKNKHYSQIRYLIMEIEECLNLLNDKKL